MTTPDHTKLDADAGATGADITAYEQAVTAALAQLQAQLTSTQADDTAKTAALAAAKATIAQLQAQLAAQQQPTVTQFADFTQTAGTTGMFPSGSVTGPGVAQQTYQMTANTSTHAGMANALVKPTPNPLRLMRVGTLNPNAPMPGLQACGFTLQGTPQGSGYGGLMACYAPGVALHDLLVEAIPGSASGPPGETFSLEVWHCDDATITAVTIDGRDWNGNPAAATLLGVDNSNNVTIADLTANYAQFGFGMAPWLCGKLDVTDTDLSHNRQAINIEQPTGLGSDGKGAMTFTRVNMSFPQAGRPHITCNGNLASIPLTIVDPIVDTWPVKVGILAPGKLYKKLPQAQKPSDVHLIINGQDVSSDPTKLQIVNTWTD